MEPIIRCENVSFTYGEEPVLSDVNFSVNPGEFIGIIGPNGDRDIEKLP